MNNVFLSLGSVVRLKEAQKSLMIIGFLGKTDKGTFDYIGCLYPEGMFDGNTKAVFNHNQIETVLFNGYSDDMDKKFKEYLNKKKEELK